MDVKFDKQMNVWKTNSYLWEYNYFRRSTISQNLKTVNNDAHKETIVVEDVGYALVHRTQLVWYRYVNRMEDEKLSKSVVKCISNGRTIKGWP